LTKPGKTSMRWSARSKKEKEKVLRKKTRAAEAPQKRIGIFGGVFDPVHTAHKAIVRNAIKKLRLNALYIVPAGDPPHKARPALAAAKRLLLLKEAFCDLKKVVVSDIEIRRKGKSYTCDTLSYFKKLTRARLFFIMGADNIGEIKTWRNPKKIFALATIAVVPRPGYRLLEAYPEYASKMKALKIAPLDISSTDIRGLLLKGKNVVALVPKKAAVLIRNNRWYKGF
jgi:nicotinate-nucleotide adenylyltransferase